MNGEKESKSESKMKDRMKAISKVAERYNMQLKHRNLLMKKRSTRSKIPHGTRKPCRWTAISARAETVPAEFCQVKEHKENAGTFKKRRSTAIFDRGGCVRAKVNCMGA